MLFLSTLHNFKVKQTCHRVHKNNIKNFNLTPKFVKSYKFAVKCESKIVCMLHSEKN